MSICDLAGDPQRVNYTSVQQILFSGFGTHNQSWNSSEYNSSKTLELDEHSVSAGQLAITSSVLWVSFSLFASYGSKAMCNTIYSNYLIVGCCCKGKPKGKTTAENIS